MARVREEVFINATPDKVWSFVTEPDRLVQWRTDIRKIEFLDKGKPRKGKRYYVEKEIRNQLKRFDCEIASYEEGRLFSFVGEAPNFARVSAEYKVVPEKGGCRFVIDETVDVIGMKVFKSLFDKVFIQRGLSKTIAVFLENLKRVIDKES